MIQEKCLNAVFLMETKLKTKRLENIKRRLCFNGYFVVDAIEKRRISLLWKGEGSVEIHNYSRIHISAWLVNGNSSFKVVF